MQAGVFLLEYLPLTLSQVANYCPFYALLLWDSENTLQTNPVWYSSATVLWLHAFLLPCLQSLEEAALLLPRASSALAPASVVTCPSATALVWHQGAMEVVVGFPGSSSAQDWPCSKGGRSTSLPLEKPSLNLVQLEWVEPSPGQVGLCLTTSSW